MPTAELAEATEPPATTQESHEIAGTEVQVDTESTEQLVKAAKEGELKTVTDLLALSKTQINSKYNGWTALGSAAREGHIEIVRLRVRNGAKLEILMDVGWGVLPGDGTALNWAAERGHLGIVKLLVAEGAKLDVVAKTPAFFGTGGSPLKMAAGKGHLEVVKFLFASGAEIDTPEESRGWDAFLCACEQGELDMVKYFVSVRGLPVDRRDSTGRRPLEAAAKEERIEVMEYLETKGANLKATNADGSSLLHLAAEKGKLKTAVWLAKRGVDRKVENAAGDTPRDIAKQRMTKDNTEKNQALDKCLDWEVTPRVASIEDPDTGCVVM